MARADDYRRYAAECLRLAQRAKTAADRVRLLEIAHAWSEMAAKVAAQTEDNPKDPAERAADEDGGER